MSNHEIKWVNLGDNCFCPQNYKALEKLNVEISVENNSDNHFPGGGEWISRYQDRYVVTVKRHSTLKQAKKFTVKQVFSGMVRAGKIEKEFKKALGL